MSTRRIVLVRHAMPLIEESVPSADWKLYAPGREAATALAEHLRDFSFESIASSPEPKAVGTAQAIGERLGLAVEIDDGLAEHGRRSVGFMTRQDIETGIANLFGNPSERVFGDETADACFVRFQQALERQLAKRQGDVVAVTHGTILSIYVSRVCGVEAMPFWRGLGIPTAVVLTGTELRVVEP